MGRASFKDGGVFAQNLQASNVTLTLGGTGTDTTSVVFAKTMKSAPKAVVPSVQSDVALTAVRAYSITSKGFTLKATSSSLTGTCVIGYVAYDDSYR
jgi:hypothetical protein